MAINRRAFLQASLGTSFLTLSGCSRNDSGLLLGGYRARDNTFGVAAIRPDGQALWFSQLPRRLHEIAVQEDNSWVAAVARRPGEFIALLDLFTGEVLGQIDAPQGFVFEGHALWHKNSLWATAAATNGDGHLLRYDFSSGATPSSPTRKIQLPGIGPHQVVEADGGLVVAMGGWKTHDREILNADDFNAALVRIDPASLAMQITTAPMKELSVRHLATDGSRVWAAMQYARPRATPSALVYQAEGSGWRPLGTPDKGWGQFSGYIGSIAVTQTDLVATSPQGHAFGRWDLLTGQCIETSSVLDVCPAVATEEKWFLGAGTGEIRSSSSKWHHSDFFWDNHWAYANA